MISLNRYVRAMELLKIFVWVMNLQLYIVSKLPQLIVSPRQLKSNQ